MILTSLLLTLALQGQGQPATRFGAIVLQNFRNWDANGDGVLGKDEINAAVVDPRYRDQTAAVLASLKEWLDYVKVTPTLNELWFYQYHVLKFPPLDPSLSAKDKEAVNQQRAQYAPGLIGRYETAIGRIRRGPYPLYKPSGPSLDDIHQGGQPDCWLVAALGGTVARNPLDITSKIEVARDGYIVHYADGQAIPVGPITDAEIALAGADLSRGLWIRVFERSWRFRKPTTLHRRSPKTGVVTVTLQTNDALSGHFFDAILGYENINVDPPATGLTAKCADIRDRLKDNLAHHRLVYCVSGRGKQYPGMPNAHWQTVFGYDAPTDAILVWNPWGDTTRPGEAAFPRRGGFYNIPVEAFARSFWSIVFETDEPMRVAKPGETE